MKFVLVEIESSTPAVYFQNTNTYESHYLFINHLGEEFRRVYTIVQGKRSNIIRTFSLTEMRVFTTTKC